MSSPDTACEDDSCGTQSAFTDAVVQGPDIHWVIVDGYLDASGPFSLNLSIVGQQ